MTPTPAQIAEWREEFEATYGRNKVAIRKHTHGIYMDWNVECEWQGYRLARTEQATEIAELKAKLTEVMPLAKFGAEVANHVDGMGAVSSVAIWRIATRVGVLTEDESEYAPKIGDVIEQLLKD